MQRQGATRWLLLWPLWLLLITALVTASWLWNLRTLEQQELSLALERGRYTFKMIEATRLWVAQHGVAYVKQGEKSPPNPYLEIPERDITTPSGVALTAVNPAYMTRQLAEILETNHNLLIHLTSLKPLNPNNQPDPWETRALAGFASGTREILEVTDRGGDGFIRFMAPLFVKPACLRCHQKQGYEVGDVRGGISVSFAFAPFREATASQRRNLHWIHLAAWLLLSLSALITTRLIRRHERALEQARDDAELLVQ